MIGNHPIGRMGASQGFTISKIQDQIDLLCNSLWHIDKKTALATVGHMNGWLQSDTLYDKAQKITFCRMAVVTYRLYGEPAQEQYFHERLNHLIRNQERINESDRLIDELTACYGGGMPALVHYLKMRILSPLRRMMSQ